MTEPINVSTLQDISGGLADLQEQMEAIQRQAREQGNTLFMEAVKSLFDRYEFLGSLSWTQYTPYFNDGDECVFSSDHDYASINSVKDVENGTEGGCEEQGEDFYARSQEVHHLGYEQKMEKSERYGERAVSDYSHPITEPNKQYDPAYDECAKTVEKFLKQFSDDMMGALFGDHALITVTRAGVEVDHYEHE